MMDRALLRDIYYSGFHGSVPRSCGGDWYRDCLNGTWLEGGGGWACDCLDAARMRAVHAGLVRSPGPLWLRDRAAANLEVTTTLCLAEVSPLPPEVVELIAAIVAWCL